MLDLEDDNVGDVASSDLATRRLWHPQQTDHAIAEEQLGGTSHLYWTLLDHLNSLRDVVEYDSGSVSVVKHVGFDVFGQVVSDTAPGVVLLPGYTGKLLDPETGLQYNINRWYDARTGRWMSTDPIGFAAADANLYRYVGNGVLWQVDDSGLGCRLCFKPTTLVKEVRDSDGDLEMCIYEFREDKKNPRNRDSTATSMPRWQRDCGCTHIEGCEHMPDEVLDGTIVKGLAPERNYPWESYRCPDPSSFPSTCTIFVSKGCQTETSLEDCLRACDKRGDRAEWVCKALRGLARKVCEATVGLSEQACKDYCQISRIKVKSDKESKC